MRQRRWIGLFSDYDYKIRYHPGKANVVVDALMPLRFDTIRLVKNGYPFYGLRSEDPNQHLKDFLKTVDSLDLNVENRERTRLHLFQFSLRDQASNWLERLPAGSIFTWEDLTTRFLAQFYPPGRTDKLQNDILMFQQHQGESLSEAWTRFKDIIQKVPHHDVPNASDHRLIKLENQVQRLMEAHLPPKPSIQVNKIASSCEICSGPHDTNYCMENPEQAFVDYASSRTNKAGNARLSKFEADFKQQQSEITIKIDTFLKAINDRMMGALPSDMVKNSKLNVNPTSSVLSARSYPIVDPQIKTLMVSKTGTPKPKEPKKTLEDEFMDLHLKLPVLEVLAHASIYNAILDKYVESLELGDSKPFDTLANLGFYVNLIPLYHFKKRKIRLVEKTDHVFGLADGTKSYPVGIVKNVEVHIGKLKLLEYFYVIDMEKEPACPLLIGRGFLATASVVIDCRKAKNSGRR
ncbi:MAK10-like protein, partial [Tanacetum coccineum]